MNRSFPLSPPPNHTPLYLLPLAHGPTMSYIGWVQAGGAWALRVPPFQICPRVCLLLMYLPQPGDSPSVFPGLSCGLSFGLSLQSEAGPRMIMGFIFLWPTFGFLYCLPCWTCNSYRNDSILLDPFLGRPFYSFSQWPITGTVLFFFTHGLLCPFSFFLLGIHGPFANSFGLPRPCLLILHSHGLCS